jgi:two-component system OmpR family sensor kinase
MRRWRDLAGPMNSLRVRLLCGMLVGIIAFGAAWYSLRAWELNLPETGYVDERLRDIARLTVESIPRTLSPDGSVAAYSLADTMEDPVTETIFQVWHMPTRKLVLRSPITPDAPLKPDFTAGYGYNFVGGEEWRVYAISDATGTIQVQTARSPRGLDATYRQWVREGAIAAAGIFVLLAVIMWTAIHLSLRPLDQARATISGRPPFDNSPLEERHLPGEIRPFVLAINHLLARQDAALERERQLIADAAHELRTPLAAIQAQAQRAASAASGGDMQATRAEVAKLQGVASRATRLVEQLLDQARLDSDDVLAMEVVDLADLIDLVARDFEGAAARKSQRISISTQTCPVLGNVDALGILLGNLLDNAVRYTPPGGHIRLSCGLHDTTPVLDISDDGPGIPAAYRSRIYDRFFRVPGRDERGTGIGLALVSRIARLHNAELVEMPTQKGFQLIVRFPQIAV